MTDYAPPPSQSQISGRATNTATRNWSGGTWLVGLIWLVAGIIMLFLAGDFIFHATAVGSAGFGKFVYNVGGYFARPFDAIFGNAQNKLGNVAVWADVLAIVIYAIVAVILTRLYSLVAHPKATTS